MADAESGHIGTETGIVYGDIAGERLLLDLYFPQPRDLPSPCVVAIHGGGMWTGSRADMAGPARGLARAGYVVACIDYRLVDAATGRHRWPAQLDDAQRAVRWVRAYADRLGVDPARVAACGWSAGGQLAALLGTRDTRDGLDAPLASFSSRVECVVDLAGDVDLAAYTQPPELDEVVALLGGGADEAPEQYRDATPLTWIDARAAPFLIIHGLDDDVVPVSQSRRLVARLRAAEVSVRYEEIQGIGHHQLDWPLIQPLVLPFLNGVFRPAR